ncbi:hypothetical protein N9260_00475 [bacterium]|nr:hypothetical protein [bacterium]
MVQDPAAPNPLLHTFLEQQLNVLTQQQEALQAQKPDIDLLNAFFQRLLLGDSVSSI